MATTVVVGRHLPVRRAGRPRRARRAADRAADAALDDAAPAPARRAGRPRRARSAAGRRAAEPPSPPAGRRAELPQAARERERRRREAQAAGAPRRAPTRTAAAGSCRDGRADAAGGRTPRPPPPSRRGAAAAQARGRAAGCVQLVALRDRGAAIVRRPAAVAARAIPRSSSIRRPATPSQVFKVQVGRYDDRGEAEQVVAPAREGRDSSSPGSRASPPVGRRCSRSASRSSAIPPAPGSR